MKKIAILMGSASDLPIAEDAAKTLEQLNIPFVVKVCSAHRTPDKLQAFAHSAREEDFGALICIAGLAAHLAGAAAAQTTLPVVGVPALSGHLGGMDALLSTVQMPPGIPVATVAINAGRNAALLCAQMLAITDSALADKLMNLRTQMAEGVTQTNEEISKPFDTRDKEKK